ncbi:MAG TPA: M23 family metallopeptidase [Ilumatobacteraceae bacterium]|jgi:murein DD-endopeptidase MepM/ murein hydrolase activator NlpD
MFWTKGHHRFALAVAGAALTIGTCVVVVDDPVHAAVTGPTTLEVAATALKPAVRLSQSGVLMFPMNPLPKCALSKTSFGQPRPNGRTHEGIDLMASLGQEIYAVDNGTLTRQTFDGAANATLSGNAWYLTMPDKTYYFYAHLSKFADGLSAGSVVTRGQLIGYVGDTGDPGPGNYHLHFEVHPKGGAAVNPYPLLTIPKTCTVVP